MTQSSLHTIMFDGDATLLSTDMAALDGLLHQVGTLVPRVPTTALLDMVDQWASPWPPPLTDTSHAAWTQFAEQHALPYEAVATLQSFGAQYPTCFSAYLDTRPCLTVLRTYFPHLHLALCTHWSVATTCAVLRHAHVDPTWFQRIMSHSRERAVRAETYAVAERSVGQTVEPHGCVVVSDVPARVTAATAQGMRAILMDRSDVYQQWTGERMHSLRALPQRLLAYLPLTMR